MLISFKLLIKYGINIIMLVTCYGYTKSILVPDLGCSLFFLLICLSSF